MRPFKPILGAGKGRGMTDDEFFAKVRYPVIATPKLDGIRCVTLTPVPGFTCSRPALRSLDDVPNVHIRKLMMDLPPGLDGELMTYGQAELFDKEPRVQPFYQIQSSVMSHAGTPDFKFHVFDHINFDAEYPWNESYRSRLDRLVGLKLPDFCVRVEWATRETREEIEEYEAWALERGYEGICWRHYDAPYKYGRSTLREQALVKMKRFITAEAKIVGTYPLRHNANEAKINALGHQERSTHAAGMVEMDTLGGFEVEDVETGAQFCVGSGFTQAQRDDYWVRRAEMLGQLVTYKCQPHGKKEKPRIPIFIAIRDPRDLS